jgi:hypothetical protein
VPQGTRTHHLQAEGTQAQGTVHKAQEAPQGEVDNRLALHERGTQDEEGTQRVAGQVPHPLVGPSSVVVVAGQ